MLKSPLYFKKPEINIKDEKLYVREEETLKEIPNI